MLKAQIGWGRELEGAGKARSRQKMYKTIRLVTVYCIITEPTASYKASYIIDGLSVSINAYHKLETCIQVFSGTKQDFRSPFTAFSTTTTVADAVGESPGHAKVLFSYQGSQV